MNRWCCDLLLNLLNLDLCITHTQHMRSTHYLVNAHHYLMQSPVVVDLFSCQADESFS